MTHPYRYTGPPWDEYYRQGRTYELQVRRFIFSRQRRVREAHDMNGSRYIAANERKYRNLKQFYESWESMSKSNEKGFIEPVIAFVIGAIVVGLLIVGIVAFVNWNNNRQHTLGRGDAPTGDINKDARKVYELPDRFSNVAMFCDEYGNSVYVTTKSDYSRGIFALKGGCVK